MREDGPLLPSPRRNGAAQRDDAPQALTGAADMHAAQAQQIDGAEAVQLMEPVPDSQQLAVEFANISAWVPDAVASAQKQSLLGKLTGKLRLGRSMESQSSPKEKQVTANVLHVAVAKGIQSMGMVVAQRLGQPVQKFVLGVSTFPCRYCSPYQGHVSPGKYWHSWGRPGLARPRC